MCPGSAGSTTDLADRFTHSTTSRPGGLLLGQDLDRPRHDPAVDLLDRGRSARRCRGSSPGGITSPFSPSIRSSSSLRGIGSRAQRHDRLRVEHEGVVGQGVADPIGPGHAREHALLAVLGRVVQDGPGAAGLLGVVHRDVGLHEQLLGGQLRGRRRTSRRRCWRRPCPRRGRRARPGRPRRPPRAGSPATSSAPSSSMRGRITANSSPPRRASTSVRRSRVAHRLADARDQLVADRVAERVVDVLEVVEVDREHGDACCS